MTDPTPAQQAAPDSQPAPEPLWQRTPPFVSVLGLVKDEDPIVRRNIVIGASICGLANAGLLAVINASTGSGKAAAASAGKAASTTAGTLGPAQQSSALMFVVFLLLMVVYYFCYRYTYHQTTAVFQSALHKVKVRVADKLRHAEYQELEKMGVSEIFDRISESLTVISDSATTLTTCLMSAVMLGFTALYMASISMVAFALTAGLIAAGLSVYMVNLKQIKVYMRETVATRLRFFDGITDLLHGAKEVKFNPARGEELYRDIHATADSLRSSTEKSHRLLDDNALFAQCNFFLLLGTVAFVAPMFHSTTAQSTTSLIAGIIFIMGPLSSVILGIPAFTRANLAAENIDALETRLNDACRDSGTAEDPWGGKGAGRVDAQGLVYRYRSPAGMHPAPLADTPGAGDGFQIGPLDLHVDPGEVVFIVGGNGSGKSTLLKVLTALYAPISGSVRMEGIAVAPHNAQAYRERFAVIFGDFHLFKKPYGLGAVDPQRVSSLLRQMQIDDKTRFADGSFTTLDLSTGQRKRLAMVVALLEDRPIYAFDEWAADQDPDFRRHFYREMIPELKRRGKTVIVVTHDDQYFDAADRVIVMEYGKIRSVSAAGGAPAAA